MASYSSGKLLVVAVLVMAVATVVGAQGRGSRKYVVGGKAGWTVNVDYLRWASGKDFGVGDSLVFNYPKGAHNVIKVNQTEFKTCSIPITGDQLTSGNDTVLLDSPGNKYYFCGVRDHCAELRQKLAITVRSRSTSPPAGAPSPSKAMPPSPAGGATEGRPSVFFGFLW